MKVLIACEFSGIVREAFKARGHDAWSCDLQKSLINGKHYEGDVFDIINNGFDLMIAFPPCTFLTVTGNKWFKPEFKDRFPDRYMQRVDGIKFFIRLAEANIEKIAIENPVGIMSTVYRKPDQIIQPYYFGDEARKGTCLWLKNLPKLIHTKNDTLFEIKTHVDQGEIVKYKSGKTHAKWYADALKSKDSANIRSKTFQGIADAMAEQWG